MDLKPYAMYVRNHAKLAGGSKSPDVEDRQSCLTDFAPSMREIDQPCVANRQSPCAI